MPICQYTSYGGAYDTAINVERLVKEKNEFYNEQRGSKRKGDQQYNRNFQNPYEKPREGYHNNSNSCNKQHTHEFYTNKRCYHCETPQHQVKDCPCPPPSNDYKCGRWQRPHPNKGE